MKTLTIAVGASGLLCAACALGPRYAYAPQADSATISTAPTPSVAVAVYTPQADPAAIPAAPPASVAVFTQHIDGAVPLPSQLGSSNGVYQVYVSPGMHELDLALRYSENASHGLDEMVWSTTASVKIESMFAPKGKYRIEGHLTGTRFDVVLWDETQGPAARVRVGSWQCEAPN